MKKLLFLLLLLCLIVAVALAVCWQRRSAAVAAKARDQEVRRLSKLCIPSTIRVSQETKDELTAIYDAMAAAYRSNDLAAVRRSMKKLPEVNDALSWEVSPKVEASLLSAFSSNFRRPKQLKDFSDSSELDRFLQVNREVAMFYGRLYERRKSFESMAVIEPLTYYQLSAYREKFRKESRPELENVVRKYIEEWVNQIESPSGFTRTAAHRIILLNTEYAEAVFPGRGLPREKAMELGRTIAGALVRTGYTPKWLDEFK